MANILNIYIHDTALLDLKHKLICDIDHVNCTVQKVLMPDFLCVFRRHSDGFDLKLIQFCTKLW